MATHSTSSAQAAKATKKSAPKASKKTSSGKSDGPKADASSPQAVIMTGGKQYLVTAGDTLKVEKIKGTFKEGDKVTFDQVLLIADGTNIKLGTPNVSGAKVEATIKEISRAKKVRVIHYKPKSRYFKKAGHRQPFFKVEINSII